MKHRTSRVVREIREQLYALDEAIKMFRRANMDASAAALARVRDYLSSSDAYHRKQEQAFDRKKTHQIRSAMWDQIFRR